VLQTLGRTASGVRLMFQPAEAALSHYALGSLRGSSMFQGSRPHRSRKDPKARPNCAGSSGIGYVRSRRVGGTTRLLGTAQSAKSVTWTVAFIRPLLSAQGMRAWLSPRSESLQNQEPAPLRKHTACTFGVRHRGCLTGKPYAFFNKAPPSDFGSTRGLHCDRIVRPGRFSRHCFKLSGTGGLSPGGLVRPFTCTAFTRESACARSHQGLAPLRPTKSAG
jgi:hypothetical protein